MQALYLAAFIALAEANLLAPASPFGFGDWKPPLCKIVTRAAVLYRQEAAATSFCSSYLAIPIHTTTETAVVLSTTTTTPPPSTATSTASAVTETVPSSSTSTISITSTIADPTFTFTSTTPIPETTTITACVSPSSSVTTNPTPVRKRAPRAPVAKPGCFQPYGAGAALSTACRCFDIVPSTTKSLTTSTSVVTSAASASTTTITTTPTVTVNVLNTVTSYFTETTTNTVFEGSTTIVATVYARPTTPIQVFPAQTFYKENFGDRVLQRNGSNRVSATLFWLPRNLAGVSAANLWTVSEDDMYLTVQSDDGRVYRASSAENAEQVNDPNQSSIRVTGNMPQAPATPPLQCTMTTDPKTGVCPISCRLGDFDVSVADSSWERSETPRWNLLRDATNVPAYNVYGISPKI